MARPARANDGRQYSTNDLRSRYQLKWGARLSFEPVSPRSRERGASAPRFFSARHETRNPGGSPGCWFRSSRGTTPALPPSSRSAGAEGCGQAAPEAVLALEEVLPCRLDALVRGFDERVEPGYRADLMPRGRCRCKWLWESALGGCGGAVQAVEIAAGTASVAAPCAVARRASAHTASNAAELLRKLVRRKYTARSLLFS